MKTYMMTLLWSLDPHIVNTITFTSMMSMSDLMRDNPYPVRYELTVAFERLVHAIWNPGERCYEVSCQGDVIGLVAIEEIK